MPKSTSKFELIPWLGGRNSTLDPSLIPFNQLTEADNVIFDTDGAKKKRPGIASFDTSETGLLGSTFVLGSTAIGEFTATVIGVKDYWANIGSTKVQNIIMVTNNSRIYKIDQNGVRTFLNKKAGATDLASSLTRMSFEVMNETAIMAFEGTTTPKKWVASTGDEWEDLGGTPPNIQYIREFQGRLWGAGDPSMPDRLFYTSPGNPEEWEGVGDSGALDIAPGDGDNEGITAIFPGIQGQLFVAKRTKLYRITGTTPETYRIDLVSGGIGCISHNSAVSIDQDDVVYASDRGFHLVSATSKFGDFESGFLSADIQKEFNKFNKTRLKFVQSAYLPNLNSIIFAVTSEGKANNVDLHLYNIIQKAWYRWPGLGTESIAISKLGNENVLLLGSTADRVRKLGKAFNDLGQAIPYLVSTGTIFPDNQRTTIKGFKKVSMFLKPKGTETVEVDFTIDNLDTQTLSFSQQGNTVLLGTDFILGASILGIDPRLPPITLPVDGYGRGFTLSARQNGIDEEVEIYGFVVEFENAGDAQEVITD